MALIARQATVNARHEVVGCELFHRSRTGPAHTTVTDMALVFTTLSHAGSEGLVGQKLLFANCTHKSLAGGHLQLLHPQQLVLEIAPLGHAATQEVALRLPMLQSLRQRSFHLAFNLMRLVPSAGLGQERDIASLHQAATVLGHGRLLRRAALLLASARSGGAPSAAGRRPHQQRPPCRLLPGQNRWAAEPCALPLPLPGAGLFPWPGSPSTGGWQTGTALPYDWQSGICNACTECNKPKLPQWPSFCRRCI